MFIGLTILKERFGTARPHLAMPPRSHLQTWFTMSCESRVEHVDRRGCLWPRACDESDETSRGLRHALTRRSKTVGPEFVAYFEKCLETTYHQAKPSDAINLFVEIVTS